MKSVADLFVIDVVILFALLIGTVWSVAFTERRIWPPPHRHSWQHILTWACFYSVFIINAVLFVLDWNTWVFRSELRLILSVPLVAIGALLVSWGVATLGFGNTSGFKQGFVSAGPYRVTRKPQYLGDMILFVGLSSIANSLYLWIAHALMVLVFLIAILAEETWLEDQYGEVYRDYKSRTSRFL